MQLFYVLSLIHMACTNFTPSASSLGEICKEIKMTKVISGKDDRQQRKVINGNEGRIKCIFAHFCLSSYLAHFCLLYFICTVCTVYSILCVLCVYCVCSVSCVYCVNCVSEGMEDCLKK